MGSERWAICCPGPSLSKYNFSKRIQVYNPDCIIAVNGAICADLVFDYWALGDIEVFSSVSAKLDLPGIAKRTILWIPDFWLNHINKYTDLSPIFYKFRRETWHNLTYEMHIGMGYPWREYTMFAAIALAIKKEATFIKIYGADMDGKGYFQQGFENVRTRHNQKRWEDERFWFNEIVHVCKKYGIEIVRDEVKNESIDSSAKV
ncbi:MAG: hypothetical protein WCI77_07910 [Candidatus Omnitrophota bacterium]